MQSVTTLLENFNDRKIVAFLEDAMAANFEDFAADQVRFKETLASLKSQLETSVSSSVAELEHAIYHRIGAMILFSCFLGFKANLDHFIDPVRRTFLDADAETYLREDMVRRLPDYLNAQQVQEQLYTLLSPAQQDSITTYISHLETVGPKLAHYCGYLLGDWLFPRIIPGYGADTQLTLRYRQMLEDYLGIRIQ